MIVDPGICFGRPVFAHGGARVEDALASYAAGEPVDVVAAEYGVPRIELEEVVRLTTRRAAT